jgi:hypothetical protein
MVLKLGTFRKVEQKYLESSEMWCWRRKKRINCTDCVRNKEVLHRVKGERNIEQTIKRKKANWIGHIWSRNYLLKQVIKGGVEVTGRRRRRSKQLLDDVKEKRGYWK